MGDILATEANLLGMIKEVKHFGCVFEKFNAASIKQSYLKHPVCSALLQYLKFEQFEETIRSFEKECKSKGKLVSKPQGSMLWDSKTRVVQVSEETIETRCCFLTAWMLHGPFETPHCFIW